MDIKDIKDEFRKEFTINLREKFEKKNITQKRLSDLSGVPAYKISAYLRGLYMPAGEDLRNITKALDCTDEELFGVRSTNYKGGNR